MNNVRHTMLLNGKKLSSHELAEDHRQGERVILYYETFKRINMIIYAVY